MTPMLRVYAASHEGLLQKMRQDAILNDPSAKIDRTPFTNWAKPFKHHAKRIDSIVTSGTTFVFTVFGKRLRQSEFAKFRFIGGKVRHAGRRRRDAFAKQRPHHPIATLDRASPQARRILCQKNRHRH